MAGHGGDCRLLCKGGYIMDAIQKSLEELFNSLPRNAAAKRMKAEMLENLTQRYEELAGDLGAEEAARQVIAEIGPAEEIRQAIYLASPKSRMTATVVQCGVVALCIVYIIYASITGNYYRQNFTIWPTLIYYYLALPILFFFGAWLVMKIINHYAQPKGIHIKSKRLRGIFFITGVTYLLLYVLIIISSFTPVLIFLPPQVTNFLWTNSYLFGIASVLIYLGIKK